MSEKEPISPQDPERKPKGFYLPHYPDPGKPSAMRHPFYGELPGDMPNLATVEPMGEHAPSDPEIVRLIQAFNQARGGLPHERRGELLETLPKSSADHNTTLASIKARDENNNGIVYLRLVDDDDNDKFVYAVGLRDFTNGRDTPKNGGSSKKKIEAYSKKPSDTMLPLRHVQAFYEAGSGRTYFALVGDGTHRLASAYRRGDEYVPVSSVSFYRLDENSISEKLEELSSRQDEQSEPTHRRIGHKLLSLLGIPPTGR
jgi:hypothetical protein